MTLVDDLIALLAGTDCPVQSDHKVEWRDDAEPPFSNPDNQPLLIRLQQGSQDKDIGSIPVTLWLHSKQGVVMRDIGALATKANLLQNWLIDNYQSGQIYDVQIIGTPSAPQKDGQGRWVVSLSIQVLRSTRSLNNTSV